MSAKEKAKELVDKYLDIENYNNLKLDLFCDECGMSDDAAKICALICVDEFLIFQENLYITNGSLAYQYWQEVKKEIEKL